MSKSIKVFSVILFIIINLSLFALAWWTLPILYSIIGIFALINLFAIMTTKKLATRNLIIFGGKGKGKSNLMAFMVYLLRKQPPITSIPFGYGEVISPEVYFNSIAPNTYKEMITGQITKIQKVNEWEGRTYFDDDTGIRFPSHEDVALSRKYQSMALFIPVQRHLYNSNTILNVQDIDRIWIKIRELQVDGYIKALSVNGWNNIIWNSIPILNKYIRIKYRYYENKRAAEEGMLPFNQTGLADKALDGVHMSQGRALKEIYNSSNGQIKEISVFVKKSSIIYDTRAFHNTFFGFKAGVIPNLHE